MYYNFVNRELVLAAHLKPLEKEDKMNNIKNFTQIWNQPATLFPKSNIPDNIQNENEAKVSTIIYVYFIFKLKSITSKLLCGLM